MGRNPQYLHPEDEFSMENTIQCFDVEKEAETFASLVRVGKLSAQQAERDIRMTDEEYQSLLHCFPGQESVLSAIRGKREETFQLFTRLTS